MKKFLFLIIFSFTLLPVSLSSIEGIVAPVDEKNKNLLLGDSISLKLSFWPKDLSIYEDIKNLEGDIFLKTFFILNVERFEVSKNNYDVINIFVKAVAMKPYRKTPFQIWNNGRKNIPIDVRKILVSDLKDRESEITYYSIKYTKIYEYKNYIIIIIFIALLAFYKIKTKKILKIKKT